MARFILSTAIAGSPPSFPSGKLYQLGTTIASDAASAIGLDVIWPTLCASASPANMLPLDASAAAQMHLPAILPGGISTHATTPQGLWTNAVNVN
jgi:hypothetical protein